MTYNVETLIFRGKAGNGTMVFVYERRVKSCLPLRREKVGLTQEDHPEFNGNMDAAMRAAYEWCQQAEAHARVSVFERDSFGEQAELFVAYRL